MQNGRPTRLLEDNSFTEQDLQKLRVLWEYVDSPHVATQELNEAPTVRDTPIGGIRLSGPTWTCTTEFWRLVEKAFYYGWSEALVWTVFHEQDKSNSYVSDPHFGQAWYFCEEFERPVPPSLILQHCRELQQLLPVLVPLDTRRSISNYEVLQKTDRIIVSPTRILCKTLISLRNKTSSGSDIPFNLGLVLGS
jgi:hypothetical protein